MGETARKRATHIYKLEQPKTKSVSPTPFILPVGKWLIMSDLQIPFHSEFAIEKTLNWAKKDKITGIFLNGDVQDCEALSKFITPHRRDFLKEVEITIDFIDFLKQEFPDIPIIWKPGNHEERLEAYYSRNAPYLLEIPSATLESVLSLEVRNIQYLFRRQKVMAHKLPIFHGHEVRGGGNPNLVSPARWLFLKAKHSAMCGHFHKTSEHPEMNIEGKLMITWTTGCLCSLNPDWNPYANNWNWGFATINIEKDGYEVRNFRIFDDGQIK